MHIFLLLILVIQSWIIVNSQLPALMQRNQQVAYPVYNQPIYQSNVQNDNLQNYYQTQNTNFKHQQSVNNQHFIASNQNTDAQADYFNREKKAKNAEDEVSPLLSHGRKTIVQGPTQSDQMSTCFSRMSIEPNKMIDSRQSIQNGAEFLGVEKINSGSNKLNDIQNSCIELCCSTEECDSSLLSLKLGQVNILHKKFFLKLNLLLVYFYRKGIDVTFSNVLIIAYSLDMLITLCYVLNQRSNSNNCTGFLNQSKTINKIKMKILKIVSFKNKK